MEEEQQTATAAFGSWVAAGKSQQKCAKCVAVCRGEDAPREIKVTI